MGISIIFHVRAQVETLLNQPEEINTGKLKGVFWRIENMDLNAQGLYKQSSES